MNNLKISYDDTNTLFSTDMTVTVKDLNYGNHLGYDAIFTLIQEARMRWLQVAGMTELAIQDNTGYLIRSARAIYQSEAFHGDKLRVQFYVLNTRKASFDIIYKIDNKDTAQVVALAETSLAFYDYKAKKVTTIPANFLKLLQTNFADNITTA